MNFLIDRGLFCDIRFLRTLSVKLSSEMVSAMSNIRKVSKSEKNNVQERIMARIKQLPDQINEAPPQDFGKYGAALLLGGIGFGWVAFPVILEFAISKMLTLNSGSEIREYWTNVPILLDFNIYIFNVTNPDEVMIGEKPILKEIGPYRYKELKQKVDLVDDPEEDTITYSNKNTWYFLEKESYPLTGHEMITLPHLPVLSMLLVAESDFPSPMLTVINSAIPKIYGKMNTIFTSAKAKDLFFDGILIDCAKKDMLSKTICVALKQNSRPLVKLGNNKYLFSFLGVRNATPEDVRLTVRRGVKDVYNIGKVVKVNGRSENDIWRGDECNKLMGTDGTIFPPYRTADNMSISAYSSDICRSIFGTYEGEGEFQGIRGHKYTVNLGDMSNNPKESCYCPRDYCLKKGVTDLTKCQGGPLIGSLPHFYLSDESYLNGVIGLNPQKEKHELSFTMEPTSGTPLTARKRFQFSIPLHPVKHVNVTKRLPRTLLPLIWVEEGLDLHGVLMDFLTASLLNNLMLVDGVKWTLITLGSLVCVGGAVQFQRKKEQRRVTPVQSPNASNSSSLEHLIPSQASSHIILDPSLLPTGQNRFAHEILIPSEHPHVPASPPEVLTLADNVRSTLTPVESATGRRSRLAAVEEYMNTPPPRISTPVVSASQDRRSRLAAVEEYMNTPPPRVSTSDKPRSGKVSPFN